MIFLFFSLYIFRRIFVVVNVVVFFHPRWNSLLLFIFYFCHFVFPFLPPSFESITVNHSFHPFSYILGLFVAQVAQLKMNSSKKLAWSITSNSCIRISDFFIISFISSLTVFTLMQEAYFVQVAFKTPETLHFFLIHYLNISLLQFFSPILHLD